MLVVFGLSFFHFCKQPKHSNLSDIKNLTIAIQPFSDIPKNEITFVEKSIKSFYPKVVLLNKIEIPIQAYYKPRNRYKADSILKYFNSLKGNEFVYIGLTNKDISTRKNLVDDYGVMGLGFCPGKACVASTFRLNPKKKKEQLFKVAIHELGHTQGLKHCKEKFCLMRDADGKNPTDEEKMFCENCKKHLRLKGWQL
jgi:archaemetzincin